MTVEDRIREITERVAADFGVEVVHVYFGGGGKARILRIFIDKPEGVSHDDCAKVSHEVSNILDVEDVVPGAAYTLEVSSPGLDRELYKPADYVRFTGSKVKVKTRDAIDGQKVFEGKLESFANSCLILEVPAKKKQPAARVEIDLGNVEKANLVPEF